MTTDDPSLAGPFSPVTLLRAHTSAILLADPIVVKVRYIIDPRSGTPVLACRADAAEIDDWRLFVPEESDDSLILAGEPSPLDPDHDAICDRWLAYHGTPDIPRFFRLTPQWARVAGVMFEHPDIVAPSPFPAEEPKLLKELNASRPALDALATSILGWQASDTVAVGLDNLGIDLRVKRSIVRARFKSPAQDGPAARAAAHALLGLPA